MAARFAIQTVYPYLIAKYRTSDFAALGSFDTGPYPRALAFNPDDSLVYAYADLGGIQVFDANTFVSRGTMTSSDVIAGLEVNSTGKSTSLLHPKIQEIRRSMIPAGLPRLFQHQRPTHHPTWLAAGLRLTGARLL